MVRLIDADKLRKDMGGENEYATLCRWQILEAIDRQPTVDSVPVVHGQWIRHDIDLDDECSNCHAHTDRALMCCDGSPSTRYEQHHFCPWCGAKMTGDFIYDLETGEQIKDGEQDG